jgi:diguanylate cyclase (GGDEF)-like protein
LPPQSVHLRARAAASPVAERPAHTDSVDLLRSVIAVQNEVLNAELDPSQVMQLIAARTQVLTEAAGAVVEMVEGDEIVYVTAVGTLEGAVGTRLKCASSLSGLSVRTGTVLHCRDSEIDGRVDREACRRIGVRSMIVVPLKVGQEVPGVLKVMPTEADGFRDGDIQTLELMAGFLSTALDRAAKFAENKRLLEQLSDYSIVLECKMLEAAEANVRLGVVAATDGMTGVKNHGAFQDRLKEEIYRARRYGSSLSLVLLDVDKFKSYNDEFGHPAGDAALSEVAGLLTRTVRECDLVARYGGEEFVLVLPETPGLSALRTAERCRVAIEENPWPKRPVTASFGIASISDGIEDPAALIAAADRALYAAKAAGRNRSILASG